MLTNVFNWRLNAHAIIQELRECFCVRVCVCVCISRVCMYVYLCERGREEDIYKNTHAHIKPVLKNVSKKPMFYHRRITKVPQHTNQNTNPGKSIKNQRNNHYEICDCTTAGDQCKLKA